MAGLVTSNDSNSRQGVPLPGDNRAPTFGDDTLQNHELVIVVKPSIVMFSDKPGVAEVRKNSKVMPSATVIDKDSAKPVTTPGKISTAPAPAATVLTPASTTGPVAMPANVQPAAQPPADDENAPVNGHFLQRGFSHAFDALLQNPAPPAKNGGATP
jgi:hypothetical protein